jgi:hypothetical protein
MNVTIEQANERKVNLSGSSGHVAVASPGLVNSGCRQDDPRFAGSGQRLDEVWQNPSPDRPRLILSHKSRSPQISLLLHPNDEMAEIGIRVPIVTFAGCEVLAKLRTDLRHQTMWSDLPLAKHGWDVRSMTG